MTLPLRSVKGPFGLMIGATYLWPKSPLNPKYPPGSSGSGSGLPVLEDEQIALFCAQWIPIPTKSAVACFGLVAASIASGDFAPNTVEMSILGFSRIVFAVATEPTLQPARVYGTHGAGAFWPEAVSILNFVSVG